jgi:BirA family biotin operon repressor/biotin-[acetyl-CoA-carboxylase] ligase
MQDARQWLADGAADGAVVITDEQRAGKGRLGRGWLTPPGTAIAMTVILRDGPPETSMLGGLAVAEGLGGYAPDAVSLKWPNDVLIAGKKVCGVLAEAVREGDQLQATILGMGVNIAVDFTGSELESSATSLRDHATQAIDRAALIASILGRIDHWRAQIREHQSAQFGGLTPSPVMLAWKKRLDTLGKVITIYNEGRALSGLAEDVDGDGALLLRTDDGTLHRLLAGDVSLSPPQ